MNTVGAFLDWRGKSYPVYYIEFNNLLFLKFRCQFSAIPKKLKDLTHHAGLGDYLNHQKHQASNQNIIGSKHSKHHL